jgi:hypothetical protein
MTMRFEKKVPDGGHYDVVVCGAGPGGTAAALAAARLGRRVLLLDHAGCVGGYWTSGLMGIALDMPGKGGIPQEIAQSLFSRKAARWADRASYNYDIETMKQVLEQILLDAGVDVLLYTRVTAVQMLGDRITAVLADGPRSLGFTGDWFVDGTGHGDLAALAGCAWESGHPQNGLRQPASLEALVTGVPATWVSDIHNAQRKRELFNLLQEAGFACSYRAPLLFQLAPDSLNWILAVNHQYGVDVEQTWTVSRATLAARAEIGRAVQALRTLPGWENFTLVATSEQLGLRDSRRIHGLYRLELNDALQGCSFADGVVPVEFCFDVHQLAADYKTLPDEAKLHSRPFEVPLRCLVARDAANLWLTGRCISGDFYTHSAYRMTCTAAGTGEAVAVALAGLSNTSGSAASGQRAADADGAKVVRELQKRGYRLTGEDQATRP